MFMWLHCDSICLKTVESVADFNQLWQGFQGCPTFASSMNIGYLNRAKRDRFNTLMREEGEIRKERKDQKEKRKQRKVLIRCQHICCQMQTLVYPVLALSLLLASGNPACTQQPKPAPGLYTLPSTVTISRTETPGLTALGFPVLHNWAWTSMGWGETNAWKTRMLEENTFDFFR